MWDKNIISVKSPEDYRSSLKPSDEQVALKTVSAMVRLAAAEGLNVTGAYRTLYTQNMR